MPMPASMGDTVTASPSECPLPGSLSPLSSLRLPLQAGGTPGGNVFVTVGTTSFDALIRAVDTQEFHGILRSKGYESLTIQIGRGLYIPRITHANASSAAKGGGRLDAWVYNNDDDDDDEEMENSMTTENTCGCFFFASSSSSSTPENQKQSSFSVRYFRFLPSLAAEMQAAALVISHAGSGSIFEALKCRCPLVVVVNEALMDNHQQELASELASRKHLFYANCSNLADVISTADLSSLVEYPLGDPQRVVRSIDEFLGFPTPS